MKLIRGLINLQHQPQQCVATIGNFDGVHLGHQAIVKRVLDQAQKLALPACVLLFEPHPKEVFLGANCPPRLTCFREKYHRLKALGVDSLIVLQFNQTLRQMPAPDFVETVLIDKLKIKHLVVGDDFHFGYKRQGNFQLLEQMAAKQYTLEPTPSVMVGGERVSSTLIRETLAKNELEKARALLGRRYNITGKVGFGRQLGRQIDFPTANVAIKRRKLAVNGVYLVRCHWQTDGEAHSAWGAANCGIRPTVDGQNYRLEVHLIDVSANLYGLELSVDFYQAIRDEIKFAGIEELKQQISKDIAKAKALILKFEADE